MTREGPHQGQPVLGAGETLDNAQAAMIMIHGRGASAQDILTLVPELNQEGFAYIAPQAASQVWYPNPFMSPIRSNEPALSSAFALVGTLLSKISEAGIPPERTMLLGFSQGACLTVEYVARNATRYGAVAALSGGLIGPDGTSRDYPDSLENTPVFFGCSDIDPHIPKERVNDSAKWMQQLGGNVTKRLYPGMGHTINQDEIDFVRGMMQSLIMDK